ncbi:MAG: type I DNA topoisomerase [Atribacterota bacterium]|nr:type I DNA topoisomerase [Atribacterota bacterium]MDD5637656.1 type I DNA topoisomerase [Atribacterota bacterium]
MEKSLIIVESPTKERVLKEMIGEKFLIISSKGHIKDLPKSRMGIDMENDFQPTWITIPEKRQVVKFIKNIAEGKEKILLATDPDREGEAISWHIAKELNINSQKCRITFNEITKNVITQAIENPRDLNMNIVNSQIARRLLDRLVGYQVSPLCYKYTRGKSAGRVQSVAVHFIVKREKEIEAFKPEEYWKINVLLLRDKDIKDNAFQASLVSKNEVKIKIKNQKEAELYCKEIEKCQLTVSKITTTKEYKHPPLPLKTSTLQQIAYNRLNFSVKRTMQIAQQLYEGISITGVGTLGLITYMRTDSTRISNEAKLNAQKYISEKYGKIFVSSSKSTLAKLKNKVTIKIQDAHEAIRPTSINLDPESIRNNLKPDQYKLYQLIWKHFIASQMKSALLERRNVKIRAGHYIFEVNGTTIIFPGYLKVLGDSEIEKVSIPDLREKEKLQLLEIDSKQSSTKPPARYNEASLVKVLEKEGIGRPSTYAVIIDKILSRGYVEKENKRLIPTKLGIVVDQFLMEYFSNIINVKFTAIMENELDKIESGEHNWQNILNNFYKSLLLNINRLKENPPHKLIQKSRELTDEKCTVCGNLMEIKNGPYGKYLACSESPLKHPTKPYLTKIGVLCPREGCTGEIIKLKSKKGRFFYGCSKYPDCNFYSLFPPVNKKCPDCGSILVKINNKRKGNFYQCSNKECHYREKALKNE